MSTRKTLEGVGKHKLTAPDLRNEEESEARNPDSLEGALEGTLEGMDKRQLMERIRYEVAQELGLEELLQGELGEATTAQCGKFGALLQKRTRQLLEIRHVPKNKHK